MIANFSIREIKIHIYTYLMSEQRLDRFDRPMLKIMGTYVSIASPIDTKPIIHHPRVRKSAQTIDSRMRVINQERIKQIDYFNSHKFKTVVAEHVTKAISKIIEEETINYFKTRNIRTVNDTQIERAIEEYVHNGISNRGCKRIFKLIPYVLAECKRSGYNPHILEVLGSLGICDYVNRNFLAHNEVERLLNNEDIENETHYKQEVQPYEVQPHEVAVAATCDEVPLHGVAVDITDIS